MANTEISKQAKIMAWNVVDALGDERADAVAAEVAAANPDIAILSEATYEGEHIKPSAYALLKSEGYNVYQTNYDDGDMRTDRHTIVAVAKAGLSEPRVVAVNGRSAFHFHGDFTFDVIGFQAFDRYVPDIDGSDEVRVRQMRHAMYHLKDVHRAVVAGDLAAMYPGDFRSKLLRATRTIADILPSKDPGEDRSHIERFGSAYQRLSRMAIGGSIAALEEEHFRDADNMRKHPTFSRGLFHFKLDHIFGRNVQMLDFNLHATDELKDRKGISTIVEDPSLDRQTLTSLSRGTPSDQVPED